MTDKTSYIIRKFQRQPSVLLTSWYDISKFTASDKEMEKIEKEFKEHERRKK